MSNENHNNSPTWKSKLEELESLPGETMPDNNAAWEKLHARLEGGKPQKKVVWYWIAAACILFLFMIPLIVLNKKDHQLANTEPNQNQPGAKQNQRREPASVAITNHEKDSGTIKYPVLSEKDVAIVSDKSRQLVHGNIQENKTENFRVYDTVSIQNPMAGTIQKTLQAIDTSSHTVSAVLTKKRLPVVHVNELEESPDMSTQVARNSEKPYFHFLKLAGQEVYNNSPVSVTKNFATINFKTFPN